MAATSGGAVPVEGTTEGDVAGSMVLSLLAFLREQGLPRRELLARIGHEELLDLEPHHWVPYKTYLAVIEAAEGRVDEAGWIDAGRRLFEVRWLRRLSAVVGWTIPSVEAGYDWLLSYVYGPDSAGFRTVTFALVRIRPGAVRVVLRAPRDSRLPAGLVGITQGALVTVPTLLGGPPARVQLTREPRTALFDVTYTERSGWRVLKRWFVRFWPPAARAARERVDFERRMDQRAGERRREQRQEAAGEEHALHGRPEVIDGVYQVLGPLGQGSMGAVLLAVHGPDREKVAVKLIEARAEIEGSHWDDLVRVFRREAETLAAVDSPYVVRLRGSGLHEGVPYLVMEYVEGVLLEDLMFDGDLPIERCERIFRDVCHALADIHAHGITHRDLSPANVVIERDTGTARLLDFGLAKFLGESDALSVPGRVVGTPWYIAPEAMRGEADTRADLYAAGMLLYRMLAGRYPYDARSSADVMVAQLEETPRRPHRLAPHRDVPRRLEDIAMHCLEKSPNRRFASAVEVLEALDRTERERRRVFRLEVVLLLALIGLAGILWWRL